VSVCLILPIENFGRISERRTRAKAHKNVSRKYRLFDTSQKFSMLFTPDLFLNKISLEFKNFKTKKARIAADFFENFPNYA